jgi:hypothetical protein
MPKLGGMAQLSRPLQIGVLAAAVLALAVVFALHRPGASSSGSGSSSPSAASSSGGSSPSSSSSSSSSSSGGSSSVYHGSAPGVEGLTRDIQRAHGAVAEVQHNAQTVQSKAMQGTSEASGATTAAAASQPAAHSGAAASTSGAHHATHAAVHATSSHGATAPNANVTATSILHHLTTAWHLQAVLHLIDLIAPAVGANVSSKVSHGEATLIARMKADLRPASQATVAAELHQHKTVLLLFVNPGAYDDDVTAIVTAEVAHKLHHVDAHLMLASQVNSLGSITREIQIYQTPTLLIVNPKRQVTTLTGLTDEFALEQAIGEAKG